MKTDRVLTMDECLNELGLVPTRVEPPGCDARHIPIAEEKDVDLKRNARSCSCDRWGHPSKLCRARLISTDTGGSDFNTGQEMR
jgi:hypothetical protein